MCAANGSVNRSVSRIQSGSVNRSVSRNEPGSVNRSVSRNEPGSVNRSVSRIQSGSVNRSEHRSVSVNGSVYGNMPGSVSRSVSVNGSEYGSVYVREKGQLCCVKADGLQRPTHTAGRLSQREFTVGLCVDSLSPISFNRKEHFVFTYSPGGSLCYSVRPLLDIALLFVANHIERVDSLVGFPEQMAHRLFVAAEQKQKFTDPSTSARALQLFSEAYGELVLKSLCLRDRSLLLSERIEEIQAFHWLKSLDLFGCRLGDTHDVFKLVTSEAFAGLVRLFLGDNCLSDAGLQRLTAPVRVMKKGLDNLRELDVSRNPLTERGLGYLTCFKKLRGLDVSGTKVKLDTQTKTFLRTKMGMVLSAEPLETFSHSQCKTAGWAEEVINQWEIKASQVLRKDSKPKTNALQFYGREKFVRERTRPARNDGQSEEQIPIVHFIVHRPDPHRTSQQEGHSEELSDQHELVDKKRRLSDDKDRSEGTPSAKRQPQFSFSAEDLNLLNSY